MTPHHEQHVQPSTSAVDKRGQPSTKTAVIGIIAELITNPIPFEGNPLRRDEIYDRGMNRVWLT